MSETQLEVLILKFLDGRISDEETASLKKRLSEPRHRATFEDYIRQHLELRLLLQDGDTAKAYNKVLASIKEDSARSKRPMVMRAMRYAALFAGLLAGGLFMFKQVLHPDKIPKKTNAVTLQLQDGSVKVLEEGASGDVTDAKGRKVVRQRKNILFYTDTVPQNMAAETVAYNELAVPYGRKFRLKLSDGTLVYLNSGSKLKYPVRFLQNGHREVFLDGEAFFEVEKNGNNHFVVNTQELNTVVLGTKFNVSSYKNERNTATVLVEGAVRVAGRGRALELTPGQRATATNGSIAIDRVNVEKHTAWTRGQLYFEDDPFSLIIRKLERHFDVRIQSGHEHLNRTPFTGTFETEGLQDILNTFRLHSDFSYEIGENGKTITITPL